IKILGSPRLDVLLHDIPNAEMFMEEDFNNIKNFKTQGKKIFIYMPTFRDTGKDISGWLKSDKLKEFLHNNNAVLVCKLHPFDKNSLDFELSEDFYKMDSDSDVYPILKYTDALITDYSSVYFDYLLLDKPILYYSPDLKEYQEKCRGFYEPYDKLTAGAITQTEQELFDAMQNVIDGVDNYKEQRKALRDRMFKYQDGRNCERVIEWIKSLDK
ncbi:CDP-glycerol glycerophosphotransferase family protein, partial [bacterium]|nr:CDP-glycerol glycerophosphotransferase family protein [bacterium]